MTRERENKGSKGLEMVAEKMKIMMTLVGDIDNCRHDMRREN